VQEDTAIIAFGGGCQGCGMADVTLKQGVETMITERVPAISAVVDNTDHAAGTNPFY
jgi:Fe/S biogenesis protein NfuA